MQLQPVRLGEPHLTRLPERFSLTSWNVWFDQYQREQRFQALLSLLGRHQPDLMAFQEVTVPFIRALKSCPWLQDGAWLSADEPNLLGVLLVSRVRPLALEMVELPSEMGRRLLVASFEGGLEVGVCHLESIAKNGPTRHEQLQHAQDRLRRGPRALLVGDFNFPDGAAEEQAIEPDFVDLWLSGRPGEPGFTVDSVLNSMKRRGTSITQLRIDRMLARGDLRLASIDRLGTEPITEQLFCSDHFGLLAQLHM